MFNVLSIRPSKDLRTNYAQISILAKQNPVAITVNGKEDTVILCHDDYMQQQRYISELEARLALYAHLAQASEDIIHGLKNWMILNYEIQSYHYRNSKEGSARYLILDRISIKEYRYRKKIH